DLLRDPGCGARRRVGVAVDDESARTGGRRRGQHGSRSQRSKGSHGRERYARFDADGKVVPGGIREQTRQALENVGRCLAAAGCGFGDVIKVTAFITDMENFGAYNEVYAEFFE